jgi:formamidopyrimidine-DNA glycosylase
VPELPEVETTRLGLTPHLQGQRIRTAVVRNHRLRWPVPRKLPALVAGRRIEQLVRRSKYLLMDCGGAWLIFHLGMSGSLRVVPADTPPGSHDHVDLVLETGIALRLHDPRRFGAVLWQPGAPSRHKLLQGLAPEPLEGAFTAQWLFERTRGRKASIKSLLMDNHLVCGVGNIYANESLFRAGIHPARAGGRISQARYARLVDEIRATLSAAIQAGGSSLRDFVHADGSPGYFQQQYLVYGRGGERCERCGKTIKTIRIGQRSAFYCPGCQR